MTRVNAGGRTVSGLTNDNLVSFVDNAVRARGVEDACSQTSAQTQRENGRTHVRFGYRSQNASSKKHPRPTSQPVPSSRVPDTSAAASPMSAARMAAEAAFSGPLFVAEPALLPPAHVTVRKARSAALVSADAAVAIRADDAALSSTATTKGPRVFRVDAGPAPVGLGADMPWPHPAAIAATTAITRAKTDSHDGAVRPAKVQVRRAAADKRPGPVLHLVHKLPTRHDAPPQPLPVNELVRQLARVEPVLADIRRAQAFRFLDQSLAAEWQRLSRVADGIRQTLAKMHR
jgi:hypothetical protein